MSISLLVYSSDSLAIKYVANGSGASRCMHSIGIFMRKSNVLNENLKQACKENPESFDDLGMAFLRIVFYATQRPHPVEVDKIEERLINGTAQTNDLLVASQEMNCYGEAVIRKENLEVLSAEPTLSNNFIYLSVFERHHTSALKDAHTAIKKLGKKMEWSEEKIKHEKEEFANNVVSFLKKNANNPDEPLDVIQEHIATLEHKISTQSTENTKITGELLEQKKLWQNQLDTIKKNQEELEELKKTKQPFISTKGAVAGSAIIVLGGGLLYNFFK